MKLFVFFIITLFPLNHAIGEIFRVSNRSGVDADFSSLQEAQDTASPGDTLYVDGSATSYGNVSLNKPLSIIGPGYFLGENFNVQVATSSVRVQNLTFAAGSNGTLVTGVSIEGTLTFVDTNIGLARNFISGIIDYSNSGDTGPTLFSQNFITATHLPTGGVATLICTNNFFLNADFITTNNSNISGTFINNVFDGGIEVGGSSFSNNIFISATFFNGGGNGFEHNIFPTDHAFVVGNNNQEDVDISTVFVTDVTSTDGQWMLNPSGPAVGAGTDGVDIGMFGGPAPYRLSGVPGVPTIFSLTVPSSVSGSGLNVKLKARSGN